MSRCQVRVLIKADLKPFNKRRNSVEINNTRVVTLRIGNSEVWLVRLTTIIDEDLDFSIKLLEWHLYALLTTFKLKNNQILFKTWIILVCCNEFQSELWQSLQDKKIVLLKPINRQLGIQPRMGQFLNINFHTGICWYCFPLNRM